jgi:chromosome segregation ATPase
MRDQLKSALAQSETEVYTLKQEWEETADENKRLTSKMLESQKNLALLESEVSLLKSKNFDLTIDNKDLVSKLNFIQKDRGLNDVRSNEEFAKVSSELNRVKAENYEVSQRALDLEETVHNLEKRCEKLLDESHSERKRRLDIERTLPSLEAEIEKLKQSVQEKESSYRAQILANKENAMDSNTMKNMLEEVKNLKLEIKNKDARIKKLEAVRLTKEQCAALKKIKVRLIRSCSYRKFSLILT